MSKIKVRISETKFRSFFKTLGEGVQPVGDGGAVVQPNRGGGGRGGGGGCNSGCWKKKREAIEKLIDKYQN